MTEKSEKKRGVFMLRGAIFDLDGTLADTMGMWKYVYRDLFEALGISVDDGFLERVNHLSMKSRVGVLKSEYGVPKSEEEILDIWRKIADRYYEGAELIKRVEARAKSLKAAGAKLAVATATDLVTVKKFLKKKGISELFDSVTGLEEVTRSKAYPDCYLLAAERLHLPPEDCAVYEDSVVGLKSARLGGFTTVAVSNGTNREELKRYAEEVL